MTLITAPTLPITTIDWYLDRPAQVNRGAYSGSRQVVSNPWHGKWRASVALATQQGEANVRAFRAFLTSLKGQVNTFLLPATESAQHTLGTVYPTITNHANTTVTSLGSNTYSVEKTAGADGYNASAVSSTGLSGDFTLRIKHLATGTTPNAYYAGLSASAPASPAGNIGRAWLRNETGGNWQIYEGGSQIAGGLPDLTYCWIWRTGTMLGYGRGPDLATAQASPDRSVTDSSTLFFDSLFYAVGATFEVLLSGNQSPPTAASALQGATSLTLTGAPTTLTAGMLATVTLPSGNHQMVMLTQGISGGVITFEPPLREAISSGALVDTATPSCHVALAASEYGWNVASWRRYGISFDVEEAF